MGSWQTMDNDQARALRVRMYVLCSKCAYLIDLSEGNQPQRDVEAKDLIRHEPKNTRAGSKCSV